MNNPMNIIQMVNQLKSNPMAMLGKRFNIPQNLNDPQQIIEHLMNTGQITQANYNAANNAVKQMQNNPNFASMFQNMKQ